jgi:alpha-beta hydrolase superfamily lysophospholipase
VLAGSADRIAQVAAARQFVDAAKGTDKRLVVYDGFRHELYNEVERDRPVAETVGWLLARCR